MTCEVFSLLYCANIWFSHSFGSNLFASKAFWWQISGCIRIERKKIYTHYSVESLILNIFHCHPCRWLHIQVFCSRMDSSEKRSIVLSFNYNAVVQHSHTHTPSPAWIIVPVYVFVCRFILHLTWFRLTLCVSMRWHWAVNNFTTKDELHCGIEYRFITTMFRCFLQ